MEVIGLIGLFAGIAFLIIGAMKGLGALPLTLISSVIVMVTNGINVWEGLSGYYMQGYAGVYISYFLIFAFSALYAKVMDTAGCTKRIAYKLIDWIGAKHAIVIGIVICALLTYGGISLFVVVFAVGPILLTLFEKANLPKRLILGVIVAGAATFSQATLPGTTQLTNIVPTRYVGTTLVAAPVLGIILTAAIFIIGVVYMQSQAKKATLAGEGWGGSVAGGTGSAGLEREDDDKIPSALASFFPLVLLVLMILIGSKFITSSAMLTVVSMLIATIVCYLINLNYMKKAKLKDVLTGGLGDAIPAIGGIAAVIAFGQVVSNSASFAKIIQALLGMEMSPYFKGVIGTAIISGITGSSSGGQQIMYENMAEFFMNSGCNLEVLHRLTTAASISLDSLPHAAGLFLVFAYFGLTHKDSYKDIFVVSVVAPAVVVFAATAIVTVAGI